MSRQLSQAKVVNKSIESVLVSIKSNQKPIVSPPFHSFQQKPAGYKQTSLLRRNVRTGKSSFDNERRIKKSGQIALKNQETVEAVQIISDEEDKEMTRHLKTSTYLNIDEGLVDGFNEPQNRMSKDFKDLKSMSVGEQVCRNQLMQHHLSAIEIMELLELNANPEFLKQATDQLFQRDIVQPSEIEVWTIGKNNKLMSQLNHRMRIVVQDSRVFVGYFKAFDKHMNIILSECEEHRRIKPKPGKKLVNEEEKRILGLVLLRGDKIISMSVDGPPQKGDDDIKLPKAGGLGGPGVAKPAARAVPIMPQQMPGLQGVQAMPPAFPPMPMGGPPRPY